MITKGPLLSTEIISDNYSSLIFDYSCSSIVNLLADIWFSVVTKLTS